MYDMAVVNAKPGKCEKCRGSGTYSWGASVNGKMEKSGTCYSCRGTGKQKLADIYRNEAYNKNKVMEIGL